MFLTCCLLSQASPRVILTPASPQCFKIITQQYSTMHFPPHIPHHLHSPQVTLPDPRDIGPSKRHWKAKNTRSYWQSCCNNAGRGQFQVRGERRVCRETLPLPCSKADWRTVLLGYRSKDEVNSFPKESSSWFFFPSRTIPREKKLYDHPEPFASHFAQGWHCQHTCDRYASSWQWRG